MVGYCLSTFKRPTYWMPLPEPPEDSGKQEDFCNHEWRGVPVTEGSWCIKCGIESQEIDSKIRGTLSDIEET